MISTLTKRSAVSFLIALVIWVGFVMIIPRAGVMAAGYLVDVPREAEVDAQRDAYAKDQWAQFYNRAEERWTQANKSQEEMTEEEYDALLWQRMKEEDSARTVVERGITEYDRQLREDLRQRKLTQERLALTLSRFSPASAFQLAAMTVAGTDMSLKTRYEDAMTLHQDQFVGFTEAKKLASGNTGAIMISVSEDGFNITGDRDNAGLDISGLPRFEPPRLTFAETFAPAIVDFGLLCVSVLLSFIIAFVAFLKYDVR
jgi:ABC-type transport system involved in multi-copper enzyme maturation permease subunit